MNQETTRINEQFDNDRKVLVCTKHELYWVRGNYEQAERHFETVCPTVNVVVAFEAPFDGVEA